MRKLLLKLHSAYLWLEFQLWVLIRTPMVVDPNAIALAQHQYDSTHP